MNLKHNTEAEIQETIIKYKGASLPELEYMELLNLHELATQKTECLWPSASMLIPEVREKEYELFSSIRRLVKEEVTKRKSEVAKRSLKKTLVNILWMRHFYYGG